ncbi:BMP family lipoprotein [Fluviispira multicolorata]|uniref:BMP family ABC transporter substrate-binding protein n=1 Tax=Fluviispira multicolorata TaxID=2654512 RepID=A0A833JD22_9BACT|nr:BMP family ABC transporter substrate-binding protein [Fluviispira multicolorata]KAB8030897.1 BMP family ABC transporter substrate-binding protein [Fluviispira multicolorata]
MKNIITSIFLLSITLNTQSVSAAINPKICMILDKAGKDDRSFNQAAYEGFQTALKTLPISKESKVIDAKEDTQLKQAIRSFTKSNCAVIFSIGINNADAIKALIPKYPEQKFVVIDSVINENNVRSIIYREDQGAFLIGAIAAMKSKTNEIGFIGGMDIPLIRRFETAYIAGAKYINPKIKVFSGYVGISIEAWNNPTKAQELALSQYAQGADIIFHAAGGSGLGVFNAAEKKDNLKYKKYAIGCDSNQNWIKPGIVLTSMTKGVTETVIDTIQSVIDDKFSTGKNSYGLSNGGVDWALDKYNKNLFTNKDLEKIKKIKSDIIAEKIQVPDYYKEAKN